MHPVSASASQASTRIMVIAARSLVLATPIRMHIYQLSDQVIESRALTQIRRPFTGRFIQVFGAWSLNSAKSQLSKLKILALTWLLNIARLLSTQPRQTLVKTTLASEWERWSSTGLGLSICQPRPKRPEWISSKPILNFLAPATCARPTADERQISRLARQTPRVMC